VEKIKTITYYTTPPKDTSKFVESIEDNGHVKCFTEETYREAIRRQWEEDDGDYSGMID